MATRSLRFWFLISAILACVHAGARAAQQTATPSPGAAGPEMAKLAKALAGDWKTTETMERSQFYPTAAPATESFMQGSLRAALPYLRGQLQRHCRQTGRLSHYLVGQEFSALPVFCLLQQP